MSLALQKTNPKVLTRPVLVLNKFWAPHRIETVRDALGLMFVEDDQEVKARIIDPFENFATYTWEQWEELRPKDGEPVIRTMRRLFRVPEVMLLAQYDKMPDNRVKFSRRMIHRRDHYTCQYCGRRPGTEQLTIDHVIPRAQGGETSWTNCVVACMKCNAKKDNRTPKQAGMKLMREPFKPNFDLFKASRVLPSWKTWVKDFDALVSEVYWNVPLNTD